MRRGARGPWPVAFISGFTLLEVMVAVAIMGLIMTLVWSSSSQSLRAKERVEGRDMVYHAGGVALRKIAEDLSMAFLAGQAPQPPTEGLAASPPAAAAVLTPAALKTFLIGDDNGDADGLRFTSLSHLRLFQDANQSDQCKIAYEIVPSEERPGRQDLVRREEAWLDATTELKADPQVLVEGVKAFNLEYYDGRKWEWGKEWDTEKQDWQRRLPLAVRVTLTFADPNDEERTIPLATAVTLPLARGPIDF